MEREKIVDKNCKKFRWEEKGNKREKRTIIRCDGGAGSKNELLWERGNTRKEFEEGESKNGGYKKRRKVWNEWKIKIKRGEIDKKNHLVKRVKGIKE